MNFYQLLHDYWFWATLLLLSGYITCFIIGYRLMRPYLKMFFTLRRGRRKSALRQRLQG